MHNRNPEEKMKELTLGGFDNGCEEANQTTVG